MNTYPHLEEHTSESSKTSASLDVTERRTSSKQLWMRSTSFVGLHRILHVIAATPDGLTPAELNYVIKEQKIYETRRGGRPALTTLYHCRNTLLKLNVLLRDRQRLIVNTADHHVKTLIRQPPSSDELDEISREAFAELVLQNRDCQQRFFDLFMPKGFSYNVRDFRSVGASVIWRRSQDDKTKSSAFLKTTSEQTVVLHSASEINAVLYGLRYWARDELRLIDEFFRDNRGSIMYPIMVQEETAAIENIISEIVSRCDGDEWTTLSVLDLIQFCGEERRRPVALVLEAIRKFATRHSGQVVLIATSRSFAALSAGFNQQRQDLNLRSYLRDSQGRYISHIRVHESIRSLHHA